VAPVVELLPSKYRALSSSSKKMPERFYKAGWGLDKSMLCMYADIKMEPSHVQLIFINGKRINNSLNRNKTIIGVTHYTARFNHIGILRFP
jgi:hypothetical protein